MIKFKLRRTRHVAERSHLHRALCNGNSRVRTALARNKAPCIRPTPRAMKLALRDQPVRGFQDLQRHKKLQSYRNKSAPTQASEI